MNPLLEHYRIAVNYPTVSGAEHLEMLQIRDTLAEQESSLSREEARILQDADRKLVRSARLFLKELDRFLDLSERRRDHNIPPDRWWWYLDVVSRLPALESQPA